ncbi:MAG: hypothetical protein KJN65_04030 [Croceitalea sp.]|nr:hypothetical protein [Croceitalea sp.]
MKKFLHILAAVFFGTALVQAATLTTKVTPINAYGYGNSFIFVERGVTFSVYPDGEFDFYLDNQVNLGVGARIGNVGITFNSGYNYNPFVQYDDYGAVIQVENVPIYYDYYGRVSQIGGVDVWYRNGRVRRLGGMNVFYNGGVFSHYTGFINIYNRNYVYRPFHRWFARPALSFCNVWRTPYRRYYNPVRYTWYRPYRNNVRNAYVDRGREYRFNKSRRANVYRNDKRVAVQQNRGRRIEGKRKNESLSRRGVTKNSRNVVRSNNDRSISNRGTTVRKNDVRKNNVDRSISNRSTTVRKNDVRRNNVGQPRSKRSSMVAQRTVKSTPKSRTVTKREVTRTPQKRSVTRTTTTTRKPQSRAVVSNRSAQKRSQSVRNSSPQRKVVSRSTTTTKRSNNASRTKSARSTSRRQ